MEDIDLNPENAEKYQFNLEDFSLNVIKIVII